MKYTRRNFAPFLVLILFVLNLLIWLAVSYERPRDFVSVSFLDVGQGDSILITGRTGNQILIDAGPNKSVLREISRETFFFDRFVDVLIATHPDRDHIGGFPHILNRYKVGLFVEPGVESENSIDDEIDRKLGEKDIKTILARSGTIIDLSDGSYLEILFPDRDVSGLETNDASIIARFVYGETCFMLTGDSPAKMEESLVRIYGESLHCDVLKVGHHGSKTSTSEIFLSALRPSFAIISAGKNNSYGHPHKDVLDRITKMDIKIFSTADSGTITMFSDGGVVTEKK